MIAVRILKTLLQGTAQGALHFLEESWELRASNLRLQVIFFDMGQTLVTGTALSARRLLASRLALSEKETRKVGQCIAFYSPVNNRVLPDHGLQSSSAGWVHQEISPITHVAMLYHKPAAQLVIPYLKSLCEGDRGQA